MATIGGRFVRCFAGLLLLSCVLPLAGAAHAQSPSQQVPIRIEGWTIQSAPTGTVYFTCQRPACGGNAAVLSVNRRARMADMTLERFQAIQVSLNASILARVPDTRSSTLGPAMVAEAKTVKIFTVPRDHVTTSGRERFYLNALLVGPSDSLSVVSEGPSRQNANENFRVFLPRLIKLAETLP